MTHDDAEEQLSLLIRDSVADIEPAERLGELRARTAATPASRRWWPAAGGAALAAAAAVVTVVALLGNQPTPTVEAPPADRPPASEESGRAVPAYFVGDTPAGPRLYREFQQVADPTPGLAGLALLESGPEDPDYRTMWPEGSFVFVSDPEAGVVEVGLSAEPDLSARPAGMSGLEAALALQQVVLTVSAGFQEPVSVVFGIRDAQVNQLLGVPVEGPLEAAPVLDSLSRVNLSDPAEGQSVGDTLRVNGVANSFEANVFWRIQPAQDDALLSSGNFTALGYLEPRLFPFSGEIDVSSLDPGTYTLIVETDDPSGGAEGGPGVFTDTRTFVID